MKHQYKSVYGRYWKSWCLTWQHFSNYAVVTVDYMSNPEGNNPAYLFPVPPGQKDFKMELDIATHSSVLENHVLVFKLSDLGEDIGCVKFKRNAFTQ
ncbi:hypothetical protein C2G38_2216395 [Gigaspora rosea]|uniref:Uncharacterized protein n=1 Tax=Gigaspora rosea TaxID=44941 RepID=A0A397UAI5_9GLOM|nr:hypothetical protein C2G38_2216395 [Gigaspora rosea]